MVCTVSDTYACEMQESYQKKEPKSSKEIRHFFTQLHKGLKLSNTLEVNMAGSHTCSARYCGSPVLLETPIRAGRISDCKVISSKGILSRFSLCNAKRENIFDSLLSLSTTMLCRSLWGKKNTRPRICERPRYWLTRWQFLEKGVGCPS